MKILIVQHRRVGDILLTTPIANYLKKNLSGNMVHFLSDPMGKSVLETNPNVDRHIVYDATKSWGMIRKVRAEKYDAVIDFMNNPRSGLLTLCSGARWKVGWKHPVRQFFYNVAIPIPEAPEYVPLRKFRLARRWLDKIGVANPEPTQIRPQLTLTDKDEKFAADWIAKEGLNGQRFIVMAPASRRPLRRWKSEGFRHVAQELIKKYQVKVYLAWGPGEEGEINKIRSGEEASMNLLPLTSIREMAAIFKRATFVLTCDSAATHTAISVDTPTLTLYGPTRPIDWNPSLSGAGKKNIVVQAPDGLMSNLTEQSVFSACENLLEEKL